MSRKASGLWAWVLQRGTAIYLALFFLFVLYRFATDPPADDAAWRTLLADPLVSVASLVFVAALLVHAWIGMRDILIDYLWHAGVRLAALALVAFVLIASGLWAAQVLILARMA